MVAAEIVTETIRVALRNALSPIVASELSAPITSCIEKLFSKASVPIEVTLDGNTLVRVSVLNTANAVSPAKALLPIEVTLPRVTELRAGLSASISSETVVTAVAVNDFKVFMPLNAPAPTVFKASGMLTSISFVPAKA